MPLKRWSLALVVLGVAVFVLLAGATGYFGYRTFTTSGEAAVSVMSTEERAALARLESLRRDMDAARVFQALGPPTEDLQLLAKWNGFGGSGFSQARVYFIGGRAAKVRWIKLGYFVYERNL